MKVKALVSALALGAAMSITPAFAQMTIGGQEYSEDDATAVQERCDALAASEANVQTSTDEETTDPTDPEDSNETPEVNEMANALSTVDLQAISLADCVEAGLVDG